MHSVLLFTIHHKRLLMVVKEGCIRLMGRRNAADALTLHALGKFLETLGTPEAPTVPQTATKLRVAASRHSCCFFFTATDWPNKADEGSLVCGSRN